MRLPAIILLGTALAAACRTTEPTSSHGYRGIERVELLAKGME